MKDDIAFQHSNRLGHTRQHWDIFNQLSNWAVNEAGGKEKVFGTKAKVADYTPVDLTTEAGRAARGNLSNLPDIQKLLESILPGYGDMIKSGADSTNALLRGEIPQDVQDSIRRSSAFKSLQGGYGGSGMSKALTARDLGRTSLDLINQGENAAQRWAGIAQGSVAPWMTTGAQQADQTQRNNLYSQITQQQKYNVTAAPDPGAAGVFNLQTALGAMAASWGMSSALGGMKGGGAGGGSMSGAGAGSNWQYSDTGWAHG